MKEIQYHLAKDYLIEADNPSRRPCLRAACALILSVPMYVVRALRAVRIERSL
jgi:hypothetical protein